MEFRTIKPVELEAWAGLCAAAFGKDRALFHSDFVNDPSADCAGVFTAWDGGRPVSSVRVYSRRLYLAGEVVTAGGVGEVCTLPEYRRKGLSTVLLKMAVEYMEQQDMAVSLLFTGVNPHYARCGWFTVSRRFVNLPLTPLPLPDDCLLRPVAEEDTPRLIALHRQYASGYSGMLVRDDPAYWDRWMMKNTRERFLLERNGAITAFSYEIMENGRIRFRDYLGPREELLAGFSEMSRRAGFTELTMVPGALRPQDMVFTETHDTMLRLNSPFRLGERWIDTPGKLAEAAGDFTFSPEDSF